MHIVRHPVFRWMISVVLLALMAYQLWTRSNHFQSFQVESWKVAGWHIVIVFLLMPLNWWLETTKWIGFLSVHAKVNFQNAFRAVISGIALSLFTPNRIGEYGGRILFMPYAIRWPVVFSTFMGSVSQNLVALFAGVVSFILLFEKLIVFKFAGIIILLVAAISFLQIEKVVRWICKWNLHKTFAKLLNQLAHLQDYSSGLIAKSLVLALARYLVYTFQFVFLLMGFEPEANVVELFLGVSCLYLFHTLIPMPPVADVLARTNLALILWSGAGMSELSISMASFIVWVINLLLPAVMGSVVIGTINSKKAFNTHDPQLNPSLEPVIPRRTKV